MQGKCETTKLIVPALPQYARAVRMLASNLASLGAFTLEEVEDVRMAAEEAFVMSCASGQDLVEIELSCCEGSLELEFSLGSRDVADSMGENFEYARLILEAVSQHFELGDHKLCLEMPARETDGEQ